MQVSIRKIGNSQGVLIPKPILVQVGLDDVARGQVYVEGGDQNPSPPPLPGVRQEAGVEEAQGFLVLLEGRGGHVDLPVDELGERVVGFQTVIGFSFHPHLRLRMGPVTSILSERFPSIVADRSERHFCGAARWTDD